MRPVVLEIEDGGTVSPWQVCDWEIAPFAQGLFVEVPAGSTLTGGVVQYTMINPNIEVTVPPTPTAEQIVDDPVLTGLSASALGGNPVPVYAVRLLATSVAGGSVFLRILQGDKV